MTQASRARFAEVVRAEPVDVGLACLLMGGEVEPDLDVDGSLAVLDALALSAGPLVAQFGAAEGLGQSLAGFGGSDSDFEQVRSSLLHEVLRRGRGLPVLLSIVWCEVAVRIGVDAVPVVHAERVMVRLGEVVVDPFQAGQVIETPTLPVLEPVEVLMRVLTNIRILTARRERSVESARTRLWATELSLLLPRHPLVLRREHGELLVRLGDYEGGARELEDYALLVEDVDELEAETTRRHARLARSRLN